MLSIILISHGPMADGVLESTKLLVGKCKNISSLMFSTGESSDELKEKIEEKMKSSEANQFLIMVDLFGGTPYNVSSRFLQTHNNINVVTGFNLPSILELVPKLSKLTLDEAIEVAIRSGKDGILDVKKSLKSNRRKRCHDRNSEN